MHSPSPIRRTHRHTTNRNTTNRKATNRNTTHSHPSIRRTSSGTYHVTNSVSNQSPSSKPHSASLLPLSRDTVFNFSTCTRGPSRQPELPDGRHPFSSSSQWELRSWIGQPRCYCWNCSRRSLVCRCVGLRRS
ncbi:hypothetical protein GBA52_019963 [Prunus armeniaca]|nr:hypothetical protein GBA52_019963 [Prunus armeniaca]